MSRGFLITAGGESNGILARAAQVEVNERMGEITTYSIRFVVEIDGNDLTIIKEGCVDPGSELSVLVPVDGTMVPLVTGPVHSHKIHLQHNGAGSLVDVIGADTSIQMDRETKSAIWADGTDSDAVTSILDTYGYIPDVETTTAGHYEDKHVLVQRATDLQFIRRLARRNGFLFWVTSDSTGIETAHFKRPPVDESPTTDISINSESPDIQSLDISWNVEHPTSAEGLQLDLNSKSNIDGGVGQTPQNILGSLGLKDITGDVRSVHVSAPADDAGDMQARGEGALIEADWFIRAVCQTSMKQLGSLVRAHTVVNIRGAGTRHSGTYFVAGVRHVVDAVAHRMELELVRNGWDT